MADENQIKIVGVKTADVLSNGDLANAIFVCGNGSELKKIAYSDITANINSIINAYQKTETSSDIQLNTEFGKYLLKTEASTTYLPSETASTTYLSKTDASTTYFTQSAAQLSVNTLEDKISHGSISIASESTLGGIKLYGNEENLGSNDFSVQLNAESAYVQLNNTKLNNIVSELNAITTLTSNVGSIQSQINTISETIEQLDINQIAKTINNIEKISSDVVDLIAVNTYMFGTCTRNLYLGLSADSNGLFNQLSDQNLLSILKKDGIVDNIRLRNLNVKFEFVSPSGSSLKYNISAITYDNDGSYESHHNGYTETTVSALKCGSSSSNNFIQIFNKLDDSIFIDSGIVTNASQLTNVIRFLPEDLFSVTFTKNNTENIYEANLQFNNYESGEFNGYVFRQINENTSKLNQLTSSGSFYDSLVSNLSNSLADYFVKIKDDRNIVSLSNLTITNATINP